MQVVRLVNEGSVDKVIAFNEIPEEFFRGAERYSPEDGEMDGDWINFSKTSVSRVLPNKMLERDENGKISLHEESVHFVLDYLDKNNDIDRWSKIKAYVQKNVPRDFRLMDNIENMAMPLSRDSYSDLSLKVRKPNTDGNIQVVPIQKEEPLIPPKPEVKNNWGSVELKTEESSLVKAENKPEMVEVTVNKEVKKLKPIDPLIKHAETCKGKGQAGKYTEGCPRCVALVNRRL